MEPETITFEDAAAFDTWLAANHGRTKGVWIRIAKKSSGVRSITSDECVDVGLCWGWISSLRRPLDEQFFLQKYTPRRPRSRWSKVNVAKVAALTAAGRIQPPARQRSTPPRPTAAGPPPTEGAKGHVLRRRDDPARPAAGGNGREGEHGQP